MKRNIWEPSEVIAEYMQEKLSKNESCNGQIVSVEDLMQHVREGSPLGRNLYQQYSLLFDVENGILPFHVDEF